MRLPKTHSAVAALLAASLLACGGGGDGAVTDSVPFDGSLFDTVGAGRDTRDGVPDGGGVDTVAPPEVFQL